MRIGRFFAALFAGVLLITLLFCLIYLEDVVAYYRNSHQDAPDVPVYQMLETTEKGDTYVFQDTIFTLYKNDLRSARAGEDWQSRRMLESEDYKMTGIGDMLVLYQPKTGHLLVLDVDNHLLEELDSVGTIQGIRPLGDGFALFSKEGANFKITVFDREVRDIFHARSKDAPVDIATSGKNAYDVLYIERSSEGLSMRLVRIGRSDGSESPKLDLGGYMPLRLMHFGDATMIATDQELLLQEGDHIQPVLRYETLQGVTGVGKYVYCLADGKLRVLSESGAMILEEDLPGHDRLAVVGSRVVVSSNRELILYRDGKQDGVITTDRDVQNVLGNEYIVVEYKNGFLLYKNKK